jgi:hypothetical protein
LSGHDKIPHKKKCPHTPSEPDSGYMIGRVILSYLPISEIVKELKLVEQA